MSDEPNCSIMSASSDFAKMNVPLPCEKEPIHIINRVQPCGCLIVVDSSLKIVQCSTNAVELLSSSPSNGESMSPPSKRPRSDPSVELDKIIGSHLSLLLDENAVEQVKTNAQAAPGMSNYETEAVRNFLIRSKGMFHQENASCCVIQSGDHFILEIEKIPPSETESQGGKFRDRNTMLFMEETAKELRKCWSIEEMASLVCSKIMGETPYDRGMVYRFDHDDSGEIIYESFRHDARSACKKDSFLGLRFPASDIPRQARELFMKNTLRFVYDVDGEDHALYPSKVTNSAGMSTYTDLSLCRIRGSSFVHLKYLKNMAVTSSMVIAIIVNKKLWGLYTFHGYREPLVPTPRTRFICEMASIVTSMIMESLTKMADHERLMEIDKMTQRLNSMKILAFMEENHEAVKEAMDVNLISFRYHDPHVIKTYGPKNSGREVKTEVFDHLNDCYGNVCKDYGVVFIDDQKNHEILAKNNLYTLAYFTFPALDLLLSRVSTVQSVKWGGDPEKSGNQTEL